LCGVWEDVVFRIAVLVFAALALAGCAGPQMLYLRADGVAPGSDPVLNQQFEMDRTVCNGDRQRASLSGVSYGGGGWGAIAAQASRNQAAGQVAQGCMAEKGYVLVREDQVAEKQQELAAIAAEKARREAAAAAAAAPVASARRAAPAPRPPLAQPVSAKPI
jgi:hypothetical protein